MAYYEYLKQLLAPLGLYELERGIGAGELMTAGAELDGVFDELERQEREAIIETAMGDGLSLYGALLPYAPTSGSVVSRRRAMEALLRIDSRSFTPGALQDTILGCGIPALLEETGEHYTVRVSFPGVRGVPANSATLKNRIEQILPCHLNIEYFYAYMLWSDLERLCATWAQLDALALTWTQLEVYEG